MRVRFINKKKYEEVKEETDVGSNNGKRRRDKIQSQYQSSKPWKARNLGSE